MWDGKELKFLIFCEDFRTFFLCFLMFIIEDTCTPKLNDCPTNQNCLIKDGLSKCNCNTTRGFYINKDRDCVCQDPKATPQDGFCVQNNLLTTMAPTNGGSKGGGSGEGFQTPPTSQPGNAEGPFIEKEVMVERVPVLTYVIAGVLAVLLLATIIYCCWKKRRSSAKRRQRYFVDGMELPMHSSLRESSLTSVAYKRDCSLYRPYMDSLGSIVSKIIEFF